MGKADSGHTLVMDAGGVGTPESTAPTPVELVFMGLGGCTGIDVLSILKKQKSTIKSFAVELKAESAEDFPKVFTEVWVKYRIHGNVKEMNLKKAIDLTSKKYCSVGATFCMTNTFKPMGIEAA